MSTLWVAVIISQYFFALDMNGSICFDSLTFGNFNKNIPTHNNLLESQWNLPTKKTSSLHLLGQLSRGSWGGAVEEGEFLTGCSGRWNLGGMSNKNLLYAKCAKHVWHYLPTFHWYIESHMYGKHFIMNSSDFFDLTSIKKRRIQSVPRFNISIEVIKPLWRFQHLFFFGGGGRNSVYFFWISGCKELIQKDSADSTVCMGECTRIFSIRFGGQQVSSM